MASIQPPTTELPDEECIRIFREAYLLHMPPADFRVWDRYSFSRCTSADQALGLLSLFEWPVLFGSQHGDGYLQLDKWCTDPDVNFVAKIKQWIEWTDPEELAEEKAKKDLAFIEQHQAIFENGPMKLSQVGPDQQTMWLDQAKTCIVSYERRKGQTIEWKRRQESYFAFGVIAWQIRPEPNWVLQDSRFDVWYDLGFVRAHQPGLRDQLLEKYQKRFSKDCGIPSTAFDEFLSFSIKGTIFGELSWGPINTNFHQNLKNFLKRSTCREESVWRLHQWTCLNDQDARKIVESKSWGVFEQARADYALIRIGDEEDDPITRKKALFTVLRLIDDPLDLHKAMECRRLPQFIMDVYLKHNMRLPPPKLVVVY